MGRPSRTISLTKSLHALLVERFPAGHVFLRKDWDTIVCRSYGDEGCTIAMARVVTATGEAHGLWARKRGTGPMGGQGYDIILQHPAPPEALPEIAAEAF